ncbi:MAG: hypothetical protein GXO22_02955 [Aquificae bacterium]|nr:hypothetical protein [Aquificota bacterium]
MWYLVYEDYDDFFFGEKAPLKVPKEFKTLEDIKTFAKENSLELIQKSDSVIELYLKTPEYTARYEQG